jgi:outer membrane receptor protein involved in Fe transport
MTIPKITATAAFIGFFVATLLPVSAEEQAPTPPPPVAFEGTVLDGLTREFLPGAQVTLVGADGARHEAVTDGSGKFAFPHLPAGDYQMTVSGPGYRLVARPVSVTAERTDPLQVGLVPLIARLNEFVVVTAQRAERDAFEVPEAVSALGPLELSERPLRSTPEALIGVPGVWMQKTNHGAGRPSFEGSPGTRRSS